MVDVRRTGKHAAVQIVPAVQAGSPAIFRDLAKGRYAVVAFHDENGNGKLDVNFLGMPLEAYGFSNNVFGQAAAPSFDKAALDLADVAVAIAINLR